MNLISLRPKQIILKARRKTITTKTRARLEALNKQMSQAMKVSLKRGITTFKNRVTPEELHRAYMSRNYSNIMRIIPWERLPQDLEKSFSQMDKVSKQSGEKTIAALPKNVNKRLRWDASNPNIQTFINKRTRKLTDNIARSSQKYIEKKILTAFDESLSPKDVSKMIKGSIGLNERQTTALDNYKNKLEEDGASDDKIETLGDAYEERLLTQRADMIARSEIHAAQNYGQLSVWQEAANQNLFESGKSFKMWVVDGAPCDICDQMDEVTVPFEQPFQVKIDGELVAMDFPDAHPHCMCQMELILPEEADDEIEERLGETDSDL